ncbi:structural maintenance of chromosomes protein 2 isoform X1 [Drosophila sulfurigaster albostrigata]|uniref:structural maintenance of chromosomes protein 2 isoform X1 n=1 Tax=Drosophila sulfurigaster albostrigata TaxID=89887 RepID=UPI002D21975A|nr:structural maintenance of chromosomes protein 2 isoform X1 [Drosophila sulfurigaster albostrigata]
MYVKKLVLDGFKSYGKRTEIEGFDPEFTAITGLNGSGKSNILDSICFVLGISNLQNVRASALQDLVFKNGQAGITKATVTIVFDNTNAQQCPPGYEKCREISVTRQVVVGGKNKFLINGKLVQNKKVQDFFCSIQLNVNNPNFLIMQGKIQQVLNMKPKEVLSMVEEAAGTSVYKTKRDATKTLIEKKEGKVRETSALLEEEVLPKLDKLRKERTAYQEYQKICRDIEFLTYIFISARYLKLCDALQSVEASEEKIENRIATCRETHARNLEEIESTDVKVKDIQHKIDEEMGGALKSLEEQLSAKRAIEAKASGSLKAAKGTIEQDQKKIRMANKNISEDEAALLKKQQAMAMVKDEFQGLKDADANDAKAYEDAKRKLEAVSQGLSTNEDGEACTLQEQLIAAKQHLSEAQTTIKTSEMELRHTRTLLNQKQGETQTNDAAYTKDKSLQDQLEAEVKNLEHQLQGLNYEGGQFEQLKERRQELHNQVREIKRELDRRNGARYDLQYNDPEPNFQRQKVRGMVGKLFQVNDMNNSMAISMAAGGHLYSYVADDDVTSKKILQRGNLQRRVTFIPINKITPSPLSPQVIQYAKNTYGHDNVDSAMSLISYDRYFEPVMQFVFGGILICKDLEVAKGLSADQRIGGRCVTLEGDVVDSAGTLSGGAAPKGANILEELSSLRNLEKDLNAKMNELKQVEEQLNAIENVARNHNKLKEALELRQHELSMCKSRLAHTAFQQNQSEIEEMKEKVKTLEQQILDARDKQKTSQAKVKDVEAKLADAKGYRERELKAANNEVKAAQQRADKSRANWKKREQEFETLQLEISELEKSIEAAKQQHQEMVDNLEKYKQELDALQQNSSSAATEVSELEKAIKEQKDNLNSQNKEMRILLGKKEKMLKQNQELELEVKKKENEKSKISAEAKDAKKRMDALEVKYPWIPEEKSFFGMKNTRYDYSKEDPVEAGNKLTKMQEKKEKMERTLNMNAMQTLDREEENYNETVRRRQIVAQDKEKIKQIIVKLDEEEQGQVKRAWEAVTENFSGIFSTLLPGAQALLKPVKTNGILSGLEIKVGFNGVFKDSLGELSGGQKSLVALSLVLAMLKFSPAPLYILDEVDAALDMSHTQNIGSMLKQHFRDSQFLIVSLKDGLFNHANVLFRTQFLEGVSTISRTVGRSTAKR